MGPGRVLRVEYIEVPRVLVFHHDSFAGELPVFPPARRGSANADPMLLFLLTEQKGNGFERCEEITED